MYKLIKSPQAELDLIDIWLYIAEDQPINADRFLDKLSHSLEQLVSMPGMGIDRPNIVEGLKSFPVGNYVLYYRVKPNQLELVRVLSASRDIDRVDWV